MSVAPAPLAYGELDEFLAATRAGVPFKEALEALLLRLEPERAEQLMLYLREGRGGWFPLLRSSGGRALVIGNGFSATPHVLAAAGFRPTLYDPSRERMEFEALRCAALTGVELTLEQGGEAARLPFDTDSFELVVQEDGLPGAAGDRIHDAWGHDLRELRRVSRGELLVIADNRLGYKRSLGTRGHFAVPSPLQYALDVTRARHGRHTLAGYRRALEFEGCAPARCFSLYPHSLDFTHVVGLDSDGPRLHIGPMERRNRLKMAAQGLGLFPLLTPSFALVSATRELATHPTRLERVLAELAEQLDEPTPVVDELIATRGNTTLVQTCLPGSDPREPQGRWSLHLPLSPQQERQIGRHHEVLERLWSPRAELPVPEPLYRGVVSGISLTCERRLGGLGAPQQSGDTACVERTLEDIVRHFAGAIVEPARTIDEAFFERHFGARFELVSGLCGRAETVRNLAHLRDETRERVLGRPCPLVLYHADLRSKHVQVDERGRVLGYLDWGSSVDADLPYADLLQFLVHEYKQARGTDALQAWQRVRDPRGLRDRERELLDEYSTRVGIDAEFRAAMEACFPVFVAAMAEANWDYSRPRWLHAQFGL